MKLNPLLRELFIFIAIFAAAILLFGFTFARIWAKAIPGVDFDANLIRYGFVLITPLLVVFITAIYLIKEAFYGYKRKFQNIIILSATFLTNVAIALVIKLVAIHFASTGGTTIYPPLSALHDDPSTAKLAFDQQRSILLFIQIIFLVLLVIIAVLTGKSWHIKQSETKIL